MSLSNELMVKYINTKFTTTTWCDFCTFVQRMGYKFKSCEKIFDDFESCWNYMGEVSRLTRTNQTFEIIGEQYETLD